MKIKSFFVAWLIFASMLVVTAYADDIQYNVKLLPHVDLAGEHSGWITVGSDELELLLSHGLVDKYEEDFVMELCGYTADDASYSLMWEPALMNSEHAWSRGAFGKGVTVAVIDSGANSHIELSGRIKRKYSYVNTDTSDITDPIGHGTAVAGIIAANRGNGIGFTGVAPRCDLVVLQIVTKDSAGNQIGLKVSMVAQAIEDAINIYDCDVINLSLGAANSTYRLEEAIALAVNSGVTVVAAAGNGGGTSHFYPASYDSVISVGSVDNTGKIAATSQHNGTVNVSAPGRFVNIIKNTSSYATNSGTSFACPQVTGVCAAMLSVDPGLTRQEIMDILEDTAYDIDNNGYDIYYGHGIVDFGACIDSAIGGGFYISQIDTEDPQKAVYLANYTASGSFRLFANNSTYGLFNIPLTLNNGGATYVSTATLDFQPSLLFVVSDSNFYSISKTAGSLETPFVTGILPAVITVSKTGDGIRVVSEGPVVTGKVCNVTVSSGNTLLYAAQHRAQGGKVPLDLDIEADLANLEKTGTIPVKVTLWGADGISISADYSLPGDAQGGTSPLPDDPAETDPPTTDDLVILRKIVAGIIEKTGKWDYNGDGFCTTDDVVELRRIIAGL